MSRICRAEPCSAWDVTDKASAEHGSALRSCPLPCAEGGGEGCGGGSFRWSCRAEPCSAGGVTGKASAEHGSALRSCPLPCAEGGGEGWGGVSSSPFAAIRASRLTPLLQQHDQAGPCNCTCRAEPCSAGGVTGKVLPSMARRYRPACYFLFGTSKPSLSTCCGCCGTRLSLSVLTSYLSRRRRASWR